MITLELIGIGTGNPDHLTAQAIAALNKADLVMIPSKGAQKADLADLRYALCRQFLTNPETAVAEFTLPTRDPATPDYTARVNDWHDAIAKVWADVITAHPQARRVALLVWGDPSLYDSTLRIADRLRAAGMALEVNVVPGLTSLQLLTAAHAIALNTLADPVLVTTGRHLRDHGWPAGIPTLAVMLDGENSFQKLATDGVHIYWGAYLGMPQQLLISGPLDTATPRILATRAAARAQHGWIMDIYLLRRAL